MRTTKLDVRIAPMQKLRGREWTACQGTTTAPFAQNGDLGSSRFKGQSLGAYINIRAMGRRGVVDCRVPLAVHTLLRSAWRCGLEARGALALRRPPRRGSGGRSPGFGSIKNSAIFMASARA